MSRIVGVIVAVIITVAFADSVAAQSTIEPIITVRIHDYDGFTPDVLQRTQQTVTHMFESMHVRTEWAAPIAWHDKKRRVRSGGPPENATIIVLNHQMARRKVIPDNALGSAVVGRDGTGRIIYVIAERVRSVASAAGRDQADILALVIAHELGHLYRLRHDTRSPDAVMRAAWSIHELKAIDIHTLRFTPGQSEVVQTAVAAAIAADPRVVRNAQ
jgi:hypothetical protein